MAAPIVSAEILSSLSAKKGQCQSSREPLPENLQTSTKAANLQPGSPSSYRHYCIAMDLRVRVKVSSGQRHLTVRDGASDCAMSEA